MKDDKNMVLLTFSKKKFRKKIRPFLRIFLRSSKKSQDPMRVQLLKLGLSQQQLGFTKPKKRWPFNLKRASY